MGLRKYLFVFIIPFALCLACRGGSLIDCEDCGFTCLKGDEKKVESNSCLWFDDCAFNHYTNASIDTKETNGIGVGMNNVFEFKNLTTAIEGIRPEVKNTLLFESEPNIRTFELNGERFKQLNVHFKRECTCGNIDLVLAQSGCIAGEKQASGVWFIYGKVVVPTKSGDEEVKFEARFDKVN